MIGGESRLRFITLGSPVVYQRYIAHYCTSWNKLWNFETLMVCLTFFIECILKELFCALYGIFMVKNRNWTVKRVGNRTNITEWIEMMPPLHFSVLHHLLTSSLSSNSRITYISWKVYAHKQSAIAKKRKIHCWR